MGHIMQITSHDKMPDQTQGKGQETEEPTVFEAVASSLFSRRHRCASSRDTVSILPHVANTNLVSSRPFFLLQTGEDLQCQQLEHQQLGQSQWGQCRCECQSWWMVVVCVSGGNGKEGGLRISKWY